MAYEEISELCDHMKNEQKHQRNTCIQAVIPRFSLHIQFNLHDINRLDPRSFIQHLEDRSVIPQLVIHVYLGVTDSPKPSLAVSNDGHRRKPLMVANLHYPADSSCSKSN